MNTTGRFCVMMAILFWGALASASHGDSTSLERRTIADFAQHLNLHFPQVEVQVDGDVQDATSRALIIQDLMLLEDVLHGHDQLPAGSLITISCTRPVCGGGDGGKCKTCNVDDRKPNRPQP